MSIFDPEIKHKRMLFGERMVAAGLITRDQRDQLVSKQQELQAKGQSVRIGELAVQMGFTTKDAVESMPGFIGSKLVDAGLITPEQQLTLIGLQRTLHEQGVHKRFGDLVVEQGFCTRDEIETLFMLQNLDALR